MDMVGVWDEARFSGVTVLADSDVGADGTIVMTSSLVERTGFICDVVLVHVVEGR